MARVLIGRQLLYRRLIVLIFLVALLLFVRTTYLARQSVDRVVKDSVSLAEEHTTVALGYVIQDLLHLENYYYQVESMVDEDTLQTMLTNYIFYIIDHSKSYEQVRYIDETGMEKIRVDLEDGESTLITNLQNKSDRYYFEKTKNLDDASIYISQFDLNIENNQLEMIDGEYIEMVRVATPLYLHGEFHGIIIINAFADMVFSPEITVLEEQLFTSIINQEGYYLRSENSEFEYGFMTGHPEYNYFESNDNFGSLEEETEKITKSAFGWLHVKYILKSDLNKGIMYDPYHTGIQNYTIFLEDEFMYYVVDYDYQVFETIQSNFFLWVGVFAGLIVIFTILTRQITYEREQTEQSIQYLKGLAERDDLTGLFNRMAFNKQMHQLHETKTLYTLIFGDLNKFKYVNDTYGHDVGDALLIQVAQRISRAVKDTDFVCRLGGDEFVIILVGDLSDEDIYQITSRITEIVTSPYVIDELELHIGISLGHARYTGNEEVTTMINAADDAMYRIKKYRM